MSSASAKPGRRAGTVRVGILVCLGLLCALAGASLLWPQALVRFPTWFWPHPQPWWWPFAPQPLATSTAAVASGLVAVAGLGLLAVRGERLGRGGLALALSVVTRALQLSLVLLPGRGLLVYLGQIAQTSRSEFFLRAADRPELWTALTRYEQLLVDGKPAKFSRQKGPANLAFFVCLHRAAQWSPLARWLDGMAAADRSLASRLTAQLTKKWRGQFGVLDAARGQQLTRTLLLMPVVVLGLRALLPAVALLLGLALLPRGGALTLALAAALLPSVRFDHVRLDGSLYALAFALIVAAFVWRSARRPWLPPVAAGLASCGYAFFTLGALAPVVLCLSLAGLELLARRWPRRAQVPTVPEEHGAVVALAAAQGGDGGDARAILRHLGLYLASLILGLLALRLALSFHVVDRFVDARGLQATWRGNESAWRWLVLNALEFHLTLGPLLTGLAVVGTVVSAGAFARGQAGRLHLAALAAAAMFGALNVAGANSEVHRLWAFVGVAALLPAAAGWSWLLDVDRGRHRLLLVFAMAGWLGLQATRFSLYGMTG